MSFPGVLVRSVKDYRRRHKYVVSSIRNMKWNCAGSPEQVRSVVKDMHRRLNEWRRDNPKNPHVLAIRESELRWHCTRCEKIGGTFFHFNYHLAERGSAVTHMLAQPLDRRFHEDVATACELHKLSEKIT